MSPARAAAPLGCAAALLLAAALPSAPNEFDVIVLKNGTSLPGLILEESPTAVKFQYVRRKPGRLTAVFTTSFPRADIVRLLPLPAPQRDALRDQLKLIENAPEIEKSNIDRATLTRVAWNGSADGALRYESDYFVLTSNGQAALVRRAAVRLEQIYSAYTRYLPPRFPGGKPTSVVLVRTREEYRKFVEAHGGTFDNPAFYEPDENRIVCVSTLADLGDDLDRVRQRHQDLWSSLAADEAELRKLYGHDKKLLTRHLEPIAATKQRIAQADRFNESLIDKATERLFATLYHEAFHAYVANFVYPKVVGDRPECTGELPRWLNEGLAQIFESGIVEAGGLRLGHADQRRLLRCRELLQKNELTPLADLMKVTKREFVVGHDGRKESERVYLTSWVLAFYLTFDRRLLGTPEMDTYVRELNRGADPMKALSKLAGQPVERLEADFHRFLGRLQPDGSVSDLKGKN